MEMQIKNESVVDDIQNQFKASYPFLQLQFLKTIHTTSDTIKKMVNADPGLLIWQLRPIHKPLNVSIAKDVTVAQLLKSFREAGLMVRVYRKSANQTVETSLTDDWTLERQNSEAKIISMQVNDCFSIKPGGGYAPL